jgi:hypothetical protein
MSLISEMSLSRRRLGTALVALMVALGAGAVTVPRADAATLTRYTPRYYAGLGGSSQVWFSDTVNYGLISHNTNIHGQSYAWTNTPLGVDSTTVQDSFTFKALRGTVGVSLSRTGLVGTATLTPTSKTVVYARSAPNSKVATETYDLWASNHSLYEVDHTAMARIWRGGIPYEARAFASKAIF